MFIAEVDTVLEVGGDLQVLLLLYVFRLRAGKIALLREYCAPEWLPVNSAA